MQGIAWIEAYQPADEQEASDRILTLEQLRLCPETTWTRENGLAHMTASSMIFSPDRTQVLMAFHNIYQSWAWTGGHADGDQDLQAVALREAQEETGAGPFRLLDDAPVALDVLPVWGHVKRGVYVSSHLHLNVTFALEAPLDRAVRAKSDENSDVGWLPVDQLDRWVNEPTMLPVYQKIIARVART